MEFISVIGEWFEANAKALEGAFAALMILGILFTPFGRGIRRMFGIGKDASISPDQDKTGTEAQEQSDRELPTLDAQVGSIAVLPFEDISPQIDLSYLSAGIAMETINVLSGIPELRVTSHVASSSFPSREADIKEVARVLKVQYVVSGSVQSDGKKVRVIAELCEAESADQLWSSTYSGEIADVFDLQERLAQSIAGAVGSRYAQRSVELMANARTESLDAWGLTHQAIGHWATHYTPETLLEARQLAERATDIDADYALAHAIRGAVIIDQVASGLSNAPMEDMGAGLEAAEHAVRLAPNDPNVLAMVGNVKIACGQWQAAIPLLRRSLKLAPYNFIAWGQLGRALSSSPDTEDVVEADRILERLLVLTPNHPTAPIWMDFRAIVLERMGSYQAAADLAQESVALMPSFFWSWMALANALGELGKPEEAEAAAKQAQAANAFMTPEFYLMAATILAANDAEIVDQVTGGLRKAALL